jgi:hypothetical protein
MPRRRPEPSEPPDHIALWTDELATGGSTRLEIGAARTLKVIDLLHQPWYIQPGDSLIRGGELSGEHTPAEVLDLLRKGPCRELVPDLGDELLDGVCIGGLPDAYGHASAFGVVDSPHGVRWQTEVEGTVNGDQTYDWHDSLCWVFEYRHPVPQEDDEGEPAEGTYYRADVEIGIWLAPGVSGMPLARLYRRDSIFDGEGEIIVGGRAHVIDTHMREVDRLVGLMTTMLPSNPRNLHERLRHGGIVVPSVDTLNTEWLQ